MSDIYIVYASEDRNLTERLFNLLEHQWDVWWDDKIVGSFAAAIESEIPKAKCMVVVLSRWSRAKDTVLDEMLIAKENGIDILIARIDDTIARYPFGAYSYCDMVGWKGNSDNPGYQQLQRRIASVVPPKAPPSRLSNIQCSSLTLPKLFFSVSSYNTSIEPGEAVQALRILGAPSILVSAYDLIEIRDPVKIISQLKKFRKAGGFVLMDSGNYEASRLEDNGWEIKYFQEALTNAPHDFAFCFDEMQPSQGKKKAVSEIIHAVARDQEFTSSPIIPIVHAPPLKTKGGYKLDDLPYIFSEISRELHPPIIGIPERELGGGIIARAKTVRSIREELNKLPYYQPVHILGTGHPWAIAILVAAGADSFDGLEWCRYTLDEDKEEISHFHLFDLLGELDNSKIGFAANVAFHNLRYLKGFESIMQEMVAQNKIEPWVQGVLTNRKAFSKLKEQFEEIF